MSLPTFHARHPSERPFLGAPVCEDVECYYCRGKGDDPEGGEPECPICGGSGVRSIPYYEDEERNYDGCW